MKAAKSRWFESLFALYNTNLLRRRFHSFRIRGIEHLAGHGTDAPLLIYANHTSWWDGLAAFQVSRAAGLDAYVMMEERQLRRYFLFRKLGAFSVDREDPRSAYRSLKYAASLMKDDPGRALWMFPQGEIVASEKWPLEFYPGIVKLIELAGGCRAAPLVLRYEFEGEFKPSIYARAGVPQEIGVNGIPTLEDLESSMSSVLDQLGRDILKQAYDEYEELI